MNRLACQFLRHCLRIVCVMPAFAFADHVPELGKPGGTELDRQVEQLKREVLEINKDLSLLEQELLFPSNTQFAVFVTLAEDAEIVLGSAQIRRGENLIDSHIYAEHEAAALRKGGAHRLHLGNLAAGKHALTITVSGRYAGRREFRRQAQLEINKGLKPIHVELRLEQKQQAAEPVLVVRQW